MAFRIALSFLMLFSVASAQQQNASPDDKNPQPDKRIFGVLPNYRTAEQSAQYTPLSAREKFAIAARDSFDFPVYFVAAGFAGLYQLEDQNPSFGQGLRGYAHRYATAYADQAIGNLMGEAIVPVLLREDPRYFRKAQGSPRGRARYAASRIVVTRADSGGTRFNFSEVLGNGITAAIGNAYYPDDRGAAETFERLSAQLATDAFSNELKEFWPDIKRRWFTRRDNSVNAPNSTSRH
jgi:hypothetical protein